MKKKSLKTLQKEVDKFNTRYKVGDTVQLKTDTGEIKTVEINHPATILGGHTAVGWFKGISGCYNLSHVIC